MSYSDDTIEFVLMRKDNLKPIRRLTGHPDNVFTHTFDPQTETCVCGTKPWHRKALDVCEGAGGPTPPRAEHKRRS